MSLPQWNQRWDSRTERENDSRKPWTRRLTISVIQRPQAVESPNQGQGGTLSLPWWNQQGDSRAERENDVRSGERGEGGRRKSDRRPGKSDPGAAVIAGRLSALGACLKGCALGAVAVAGAARSAAANVYLVPGAEILTVCVIFAVAYGALDAGIDAVIHFSSSSKAVAENRLLNSFARKEYFMLCSFCFYSKLSSCPQAEDCRQ